MTGRERIRCLQRRNLIVRTLFLSFFLFLRPFAEAGDLILPVSTRSVEMDPVQLELPASWESPVLHLPGPVDIEVLLGTENEFLGLGQITIRGVAVRGATQTMRPELVGPDLPEYARFRLSRVRISEEYPKAEFEIKVEPRSGPADSLIWTVQSEQDDEFRGPAVGFSYQFHFMSESERRIQRIIDLSSWSLEGNVTGCLYVEQSNPYGVGGSKCFVITPQTEIPTRKRLPFRITAESRFGTGPFLDFLSVSNASLIRFIRKPVLTFNETRLVPGASEIQTTETWMTPLAPSFKTADTVVLLVPQGGVQAWLTSRHHVVGEQQNAAKLTPSVPLPMTQQGDHPINSSFLRSCIEAGFRRIWVWSRWKNNWSEWDHLSPEDRSRIGTEQPLSHAVLDFDWASNVNPAKLRDYANQAQQMGIELFLWFPSSYLSNVSPLLKSHPDWIVRTAKGEPYHYAYPDLQAVFQARGYQDYAISRLKFLRQEVWFPGIWLDSFQTFGLEVVDYGVKNNPIQFPTMLEFARRLKKEGLSIYVEALTPWLLSSAGLWNPTLVGKEYLLTETAPHMGAETLDAGSYFRLLAFKCAPVIRLENFLSDERLNKLGSYVNKAYTEVVDDMDECELIGNGEGVLWTDSRKDPRVLFTFRQGDFLLPGVLVVEEVLTEKKYPRQSGKFSLEANRVYRVVN